MKTQLTIGKKLAVGVSGLLIFLLALSYTSQRAISKLGAALDIAVNSTAKKVDLIGSTREAFQELKNDSQWTQITYAIRELERKAGAAGRGETLSCSNCHATAAVEDSIAQLEAAATVVKQRIGELRPLVSESVSRKALDAVDTGASNWVASNKEYLRLAGAGRFEDAHAVLRDKMFPILGEVEKAAKLLADREREALALSNREAQSTNAWSRWTAYALILLNMLLGGAVLWLVYGITTTLRQAVAEMGKGAEQVASAAAEVSSSSQSLAQGSSEQAASLQETAASSEQVSSMTRKNAESAESAAGLTQQVTRYVAEANRTLEEMMASMKEITAASDKISHILKVIDEIAFQTNILALNAAVEAARAGEAGMGFAVVADEVRNLAHRSAQAARDTAAMIEETIAKSREGDAKLGKVAEAIRAITESAGMVKTLIEEVNAGSHEQARGIEQISQAVTQMERVTQQAAASAEQGASASQELNAEAEAMRATVQRLRVMVDGAAVAG